MKWVCWKKLCSSLDLNEANKWWYLHKPIQYTKIYYINLVWTLLNLVPLSWAHPPALTKMVWTKLSLLTLLLRLQSHLSSIFNICLRNMSLLWPRWMTLTPTSWLLRTIFCFRTYNPWLKSCFEQVLASKGDIFENRAS